MHLKKIVLAAAFALLGAGAAQAATVTVEFSGALTYVESGQPYAVGDTITYGFVIDDSQTGTDTFGTTYTPLSSYFTINGALVDSAGISQRVEVSDDTFGQDSIEASFEVSDGVYSMNLVDNSEDALNDESLDGALSVLSSNGLSDFSVANGSYNDFAGEVLSFDLNSVSVMAAIPLPASALLLGAGVLVLGAVGARRRKRAAV